MYKILLNYYGNLSIANKLRFMGFSTAIIAGSLSIIFAFIYQYLNERNFLEAETTTLSKIISENIKAAIIFDDSEFVNSALASLKYKNIIKHAYVISSDSNTLASYHRDGVIAKQEIVAKLNRLQMYIWDGMELYTYVEIKDNKKKMASLIVVSSIKEALIEIIKEMFVVIAIVIFSLLLSFRFRRVLLDSILKPIAKLNSKTNAIVKTGDLSENVKIHNNDEIGELANNFNSMVATIRLSNEKMQTYNDELESRVQKEIEKRTEQEQILIQQSRFAAMGEMIGNIAHQWRQPLNALGMLIQNIDTAYKMDMLDEAFIKRSVKKGNRLTNSMSQTIDDFRNFFKPDKNKQIFNIASSIEETMDLLGSSLSHNMIEVNKELDESIYVEGVPSEFLQVVLNIFNNAKDALIDFKAEDRQIYVRVFKNEDEAYIEIEDNAGGISTEIIDSVFDPYFTTKEEGKGTGIGLYMSKTIVENNMNGSLSVKNSKNGAKFSIKLKLEKSKENLV